MVGGRARVFAALALALACAHDEPVAPMMEAEGTGDRGLPRDETLGPFLANHWRLPIPPQGDAPAAWSPLEARLDPTSCGACHPKQQSEWKGSLHAGAFSPGFAGQLIEGRLSEPRHLRQCQTCHSPLAEQQPVLASGRPSPHFDPSLRAQGMVCAGCHVRSRAHSGPPRRSGLPPLAAALPHAGFEEHTEFEESRFCARCHQFFGQRGPSGKPVQNTFVEWRQSPQAAAGETCQSCHMPDRAHTWRGIHDPDTVRSATELSLEVRSNGRDDVSAELVLTSLRVGHMLPTYVTPRIFLRVLQVDAAGTELPGSDQTIVIGRKVDFKARKDEFDSRIPPGGSATLRYSQARSAGAVALVGRATVDPDFHYRAVFASKLEILEDPEARRLITEALRRASDSAYLLGELRQPL